jgi:hypothetical protein
MDVPLLLTGNKYLMSYVLCRKCMIKNPRKLKGIQYTNYPRSEEVPTATKKIQAMTHPLSGFFAAEGPRFNLGAY